MTRSLPFAGLFVLTLATFTFAQDAQSPSNLDAKPRYTTLPNNRHAAPRAAIGAPNATLSQWNGSFIDLKKNKISYTMVGANPATSNAATTVPVYIIPIKMVYPVTNGNRTFDPVTAKAPNGKTIINNIIASPIFNKTLNFTQGGTNLGTTQYIDAFQRGNFWHSVQTHPGYHVFLGNPTILPTQTITVAKALGGLHNEFGGGIVGVYDIDAFDAKLQTIMLSFPQIRPGVLPLFVTYDIYLTQYGGCCIGGYHSANGSQPGGQTYAYSTYVGYKGDFSEDVSALSHEVGEWVDDPFVDNRVHCNDNSVLEVGDPLEGNSNYGAFPYTHNGFTWNLQSLAFIGYFGAPKTTSVHSWLSFQHDQTVVCPGQ